MSSEFSDNVDISLTLPRNLSYVQESRVGEYSVSSRFLYNQEREKRLQKQEIIINRCREMARRVENLEIENGEAYHPEKTARCKRSALMPETPDSDTMSEEGVFVNMVDDDEEFVEALDHVTIKDDVSVDSVYSPDADFDSPTSVEERRASLEEAVMSLATADLNDKPALKIDIIDPNKSLLDSSAEAFLKFVSSTSPIDYVDREFNFSKSELRKSSSLKTNKTPPGTPSRKKVVRFADAMGLDLESVRNIVNMDTPPRIPASAMADLQVGLGEDRQAMGSRFLAACFAQPGCAADFRQKVREHKVCLENSVISNLTITGIVRVANIHFYKAVRVRYTTNAWNSFIDIAASYVKNSCDGPTDRFSFSIVAPADFGMGAKLEFAISYTAGDSVYWDSNGGSNYVFECFGKTIPLDTGNSWIHFL